MRSKVNKKIIILSIVIFLYLIIWFMFFRLSIPSIWNMTKDNAKYHIMKNYNLIPFYFNPQSTYWIFRFFLICLSNIIVAIPLGILLLLLVEESSSKYLFAYIIFFSTVIILETLQQFLCFGSFDITDLFFYSAGFFIASLIYKKFRSKINERMINRIILILDCVSSILIISSAILIYNQILYIIK